MYFARSRKNNSSVPSLLVVFVIAIILPAVVFCTPSFAQGSKRASTYDAVEEKDKDRPDLRDRWMMRGRSAPPGQSAAALRVKAHQQKMAMRAEAAKEAARRSALAAPVAPGSGTPWVPLGPAPLVSDQDFYGTVGGRATAVAVDPSDTTGNTVYVAAASGGVWKSTNAASSPASNATWTALTDQQASLVNGAVSVKSDGSVVLVGTGEPDSALDSYYGVGILRSTNHGASWNLISTATGNDPSLSFAGLGFAKFAWSTSPTTTVVAATATTAKGSDEGEITSATSRGLYYSPDSGQTWTFEVPQDSGVAISPASISATDVLYNAAAGKFFAAIRYHGLYSSTNGQTWSRLTNQPNPLQLSTTNCPSLIPSAGSTCPLYRGQLAVVPGRNEMYFWFVSLDTSDNVIDEGIYQSLDGGNTWQPIDETGIANCGDPGNNGCGVDQGYYNLEIAALPNGAATDLYAGAVNLFKCTLTGGAICATIDTNYPNQWINLTHVYGCSSIAGVHPDEHGLDFIPVSGHEIMYFANDGGVYRTLDGLTKLVSGTCGVANGFDNLNASSVAGGTIGSLTQFVSFSQHPSDQNTILGGTQDNGSPATSSALGSTQWTTVNGGDGGYNAISPSSPTLWYTSNPYVNIYSCASGIDCASQTFSLTVSSAEVGGDYGAFYTPYILDPQNPTEMLVGTCRLWRGAPTVPPSSFSALSVDFDTLANSTCTGDEINLVSGLAEGGPAAGGLSTTVYATTEGTGPNAAPPSGGEVWVTTNAGITPMSNVTASINSSNYTISSVAMDTSDATGATAYVGIMGFNVSHVFKTTNAGSTWSDWSGTGGTALPSAPVNALLVDSSAGTVYAGTDVGVFASSTSSASWSEVGTPSQPGNSGYLPNVPVTAIHMFSFDGTRKLRVSTYGRGIWEYAIAIAPDYSNVISNTPLTTFPGETAAFSGVLKALDGYSSAVKLTCTGNPPTICSFNPTPVTPTSTGASYTLTTGSSVGDYSFNAHAVGTDSYAITHDAAVTLHVVDFNLSAPSPNTLTVQQGGVSSSATFQVSASGSFSGTVSLSCPAGLPTGAACVFSPSSSVTPTASAPVTVTMSVSANANTPAGGPATITLAANVSGAPAAKTQAFSLTVTAIAPDFSLAVTATPNSTVPGQNLVWSGTLAALHGYSGTVNLSCTGTPPATCVPNPSSLAPTTAGAAFNVTVGNVLPGAFSFNIHGTDGTLTHNQAVSLSVNTDVTWTDSGNSSVTVLAGQSATYTFSAAPVGGSTFTGVVNFACSNLPALTSCTFNPASISPGAGATNVTLTIATTGPNQGTESTERKRGRSAAFQEMHDHTEPPTLNTSAIRGITLAWWLTIPVAGALFAGIARRKPSRKNSIASCALALAWLSLLAACSLGGSSSTGGATVVVSPTSAVVPVGAPPESQLQFSATVINGSNQAVTWAVNGAGSINANGLYTAPTTLPGSASVTITATSSLASTPGTATVTLTGPLIEVTVSPTAATIYANEAGNLWPPSATQQQFSATLSNSTDQTVTWAVLGAPANGTIDSNGLYSAPAAVPNPSSITVTASSAQVANAGTAIVSIVPATPVGTYSNIQVSATAAGGTAHSDPVTLTVE